MRSFLLAATAGLALLGASAAQAGTEQLRNQIRHQLTPFDPKVDVAALSDAQVAELYLLLVGNKMPLYERQLRIKTILRR